MIDMKISKCLCTCFNVHCCLPDGPDKMHNTETDHQINTMQIMHVYIFIFNLFEFGAILTMTVTIICSYLFETTCHIQILKIFQGLV